MPKAAAKFVVPPAKWEVECGGKEAGSGPPGHVFTCAGAINYEQPSDKRTLQPWPSHVPHPTHVPRSTSHVKPALPRAVQGA